MASPQWRRAHCTVSVVVTKVQRKKLEAAADKAGKTFSAWAAVVLLDAADPPQ